jgi:phosphatidylinositol-3-phosphatase
VTGVSLDRTARLLVGLGWLALIAASCGTPSRPPSATATTAQPSNPPAPARQGAVPHVLVLLEENHDYGSVIGSPEAPFLNSLANDHGLATNWYAITNPSLPNYLALISGSVQGVSEDITPPAQKLAGPTLVDQMAQRGIGWNAYMEDMPTPCDTTHTYSPGHYDVNHNPFVYFKTITDNPEQCQRVVPYGQLTTDLANNTAPPFLWVSPNTLHDMHDGSIRQADDWARDLITRVQASEWYRSGGVIVVTWDEGERSDKIATIVVSTQAATGARLSARGNHYGTLRALEEVYGLPYLGAAGDPSNGNLRPLIGV